MTRAADFLDAPEGAVESEAIIPPAVQAERDRVRLEMIERERAETLDDDPAASALDAEIDFARRGVDFSGRRQPKKSAAAFLDEPAPKATKGLASAFLDAPVEAASTPPPRQSLPGIAAPGQTADEMQTTFDTPAPVAKRTGSVIDTIPDDQTAPPRPLAFKREAPPAVARASDFDFEAQERLGKANVLARAGQKTVTTAKQQAGGVVQAAQEILGFDSSHSRALNKRYQATLDALGEGREHSGYLEQQLEGALTSIGTQGPQMLYAVLGGPGAAAVGLGSMFMQTAGQEYAQGRQKGLPPSAALDRAAWHGTFEVVGEAMGLPAAKLFGKAILASGIPEKEIAPAFARYLLAENAGEQATTGGQFGYDKFAAAGLHQEATLADYLRAVRDTAVQTTMQTLLTGAAGQGVRNIADTVKANDAAKAADDARTHALEQWGAFNALLSKAPRMGAPAQLAPVGAPPPPPTEPPTPREAQEAKFAERAVAPANDRKAAVREAARLTREKGEKHVARLIGEEWHVIKEASTEPPADALTDSPGAVSTDAALARVQDLAGRIRTAELKDVRSLTVEFNQATEEAARAGASQLDIQRAIEGGQRARTVEDAAPPAAAEAAPPIEAGESAEVAPTVDTAAAQAATSPKNELPEPTAAQKEAGNYQKGHARIAGLDVSIENPAGSKRRPEWKALEDHYGYFRGTVGFDKDHLDVFVKPGTPEDFAGTVYVVNQTKGSGRFDEHKVVVGASSLEDARATYLRNYEQGWDRVRSIAPMSLKDFKAWAFDQTEKGPKGGELKPVREMEDFQTREGVKVFDSRKKAEGFKAMPGNKVGRTYQPRQVKGGWVLSRPKRAPRAVASIKPEDDLAAIFRKSGGLDFDQIVADGGDPKDVRVAFPFGAAKKGGELSLDGAAELMGELGFDVYDEDGRVDATKAREIINQALMGNRVFSPEGMEIRASRDAEAQVRQEARLTKMDLQQSGFYALSEDDQEAAMLALESIEEERWAYEDAPAFSAEAAEAVARLNADLQVSNLTDDQFWRILNAYLEVPFEALETRPRDRGAEQSEGGARQAVASGARGGEEADPGEGPSAEKGGTAAGPQDRQDVTEASSTQHGQTPPVDKETPPPSGVSASEPPELDLTGETEAEIRTREAREKAEAEAKKKREAASDPGGFTLTGSDRPIDEARARGQQELAPPDDIDDFGEKVGGARKDTAQPLGQRNRVEASEDESPAWRKRFISMEVLSTGRIGEQNVGKWMVMDRRSMEPIRDGWRVKYFDTEAEADAATPLMAVAQKHRVVSAGKAGEEVYEIWRYVTDRKRLKVVDEQFASRDDAMRYMATHAEKILETKTSYGEEVLAKPERVVRKGEARRTGPATKEMFSETFGFRGVEFGNWNNQGERQEVMNHAFDGLLDLAEILGVPPKALSLNGDLALAFGARGKGVHGARAHYEPDYGVINLTKLEGAGALAHEWFHALDHYFRRQDIPSMAIKEKNERGDLVYPQGKGKPLATHGFAAFNGQIRPEVRDAIQSLVKTMFTKAEKFVEDTQKAERFVGKARDQLAASLKSLRDDLLRGPEQLTYMKRNNKPATAEQVAAFDALADRLLEGYDLETFWKALDPAPGRKASLSGRYTNKTVEEISAIYKAVRGRSGFSSERGGVMDGLLQEIKHYAQRAKMLEEANTGAEKEKRVPTSYAMEAKAIDQGRVSDYWTTEHEMAARAFSAYVEDKLDAKGNESDFLSYGSDNSFPTYRLLKIRPFPEGAEREAINKEFDKLFSVLKTKETDKGVALFSRAEPGTSSRAFREWFGDSKVVDADGKPLVVYHGTPTPSFTKFKRQRGGWSGGIGIWFGTQPEIANEFALQRFADQGPAVYPVYLSIQRPKVYEGWPAFTEAARATGKHDIGDMQKSLRNSLIRQGYDGIVIRGSDTDRGGVRDDWVAFEPEQIKSAVGNRGTFAPNNPDILFERGPTWYSELARQLEGVKTESAMPEQWKATIRNLKGVKADEVEWSGVLDWLSTKQGKVLKWEVHQFLAQNGVKVEETMLGGEGTATNERDRLVVDLDSKGYSVDFTHDTHTGEDVVMAVVRRSDGVVWNFVPDEGFEKTSTDPTGKEHELPADLEAAGRRFAELEHGMGTSEYAPTGETRYRQYTLPGGENYRELLLTLPDNTRAATQEPNREAWSSEGKRYNLERPGGGLAVVDTQEWTATFPSGDYRITFNPHKNKYVLNGGRGYSVQNTHYDTLDAAMLRAEVGSDIAGVGEPESRLRGEFRSSHFDTPNILAHVRFNERTDADGKRVLFIEEIQSDWAQKGKREGFKKPTDQARFNELQAESEALAADRDPVTNKMRDESRWHRVKDEMRDLQENSGRVPPAPFVGKTEAWVSLSVKRMIRFAAENGFDRIAWTTGKQQADRYSLDQEATSVEVFPRIDARTGEVTRSVNINLRRGGVLRLGVSADGFIDNVRGPIAGEHIEDKPLADVVGKEMADKIMAVTGSTTFEGEDLRVGGKGMMVFYDQIVPNVVNDVLKKLGGGRVGEVKISEPYTDEERAAAPRGVASYPTVQPGFDITPALRDKAMAGLPLFKRGAGRGALGKAEVESIAKAITSRWARGPEVEVIESMADAPAEVRELNEAQMSQGASGEPDAFYYRGKVYLVASQIREPRRVVTALFHEALGHYGLRGVFGNALDDVLSQIVAARPTAVAAKAKAYGLDMTKRADRMLAAEEVLAEMAQTRPELSFVRRAVAAIRAYLRKLGIALEVTDDEIIANFLIPARNFVERGRKPARGETRFHRAYHGSPHDFDRFDISKIGTGEGAQAYGWGLYFAGLKEVAAYYRDKLAGRPRERTFYVNGVSEEAIWRGTPEAEDEAQALGLTLRQLQGAATHIGYYVRLYKNGDRGLSEAKKVAEGPLERENKSAQFVIEAARAVFERGVDVTVEEERTPGRLYEVELAPTEDQYLDWDKGLAQQSLYVKQRIKAVLDQIGESPWGAETNPTGAQIYNELAAELGTLSRGEISGGGRYRQSVADQRAASMRLAELGIPGIKYLDGSSRHRPLRDIKREFLAELPEDATADEVMELVGTGRFSPKNEAILKALAADDWLGFDYPAQALSTALGGKLSDFDASPALQQAVADAQEGGTHNYVIFDDRHVKIEAKFSRVDPESYAGRVAHIKGSDGTIAERIADWLHSDQHLTWWQKSIGTMYGAAHAKDANGRLKNPDFKRVYDLGQRFLREFSRAALDAAELAPNLLPQITGFRDALKVWKGASQKDVKAVAKPILEGTLAGGANPHAGIVWTRQELLERFRLTEKQADLYFEFRAAVDQSLDALLASEVAALARNEGIDEAIEATREEPHRAGEIVGDALAEKAEQLEREASEMPAETAPQKRAQADKRQEARRLTDLASMLIEKQQTVESLKAHGYAPLMRFGTHVVAAYEMVEGLDEPQLVYFSMHESQREANAVKRAVREEFPDAEVVGGIKAERVYKLYRGLTPDTLELFAYTLGVAESSVFKDYVKAAKNTRSAMKRLIERNAVPGFQDDVTRTLAAFITSNARAVASNWHMGEMMRAVKDVRQSRGDVADFAADLVDYLQNPKEEAVAFRSFLFVQYLGGSIAAGLINMTQPVTMTYPYLAQWGAKRASAAMSAALAKAARGEEALDEEARAALRKAVEEGIVAPHEVHQLHAEAMRTLAGNVYTRRLLTAWGGFFSATEAFNRRVTFLAAFDVARQTGQVSPYAFAVKAVEETQGVYNRGNRPPWARGTVGATIFTFKQFSIAYLEFLKRLPPQQKAMALAILFLISGLQGLPFAQDIEDLIDTIAQMLGYSFNTREKLRKFAVETFGKTGAHFVLHGASALPGVPLDVQGRIGMGNLIPGSQVAKLSADSAREALDVFGPAGSVVKSFGEAVKEAAEGNVREGIAKLMPLAVQNVFKAWDMHKTGMYRDTRGRKVTDVGGVDVAVKAIGFQPQKVAEKQRIASIAEQQKALHKKMEADIAEKWAEAIFQRSLAKDDGQREIATKDLGRARERLAEWNRKNSDLRIHISPEQIRRRVVEMRREREERIIRSTPREIRGSIRETLRD